LVLQKNLKIITFIKNIRYRDFGAKRRLMIRYFILTLFLFLSPGFAETCLEQMPEAVESKIPGVGLLFFHDAEPNPSKSGVNFSGGVCLEGNAGWQLITERIEVTGLPAAKAETVTVSFQGWQIQANFLQASPAGLNMQGITFFGEGLQGLAQEASYDFNTQELKLLNATTQGQNVLIEGSEATLVDGHVFFEGILATTCNCEGDALYSLSAQRATFELSTQKLIIAQGSLSILGIPIPLKDLELSPESLETFTFPIIIEYIANDPANNKPGTGLGIRIPSLRAGQYLNLELGLVGLDNTYPLAGILLAHYKDSTTRFDVGYAAEGPQADFTVKQPLSSSTQAIFAVHNRDWESQDFLHEGYLGLETNASLSWLNDNDLNFGISTFSAISSQTLTQDPFHDGRLGIESNLSYQLPPNALGRFDIGLRTNLTYYPINNRVQWGVRFNPSWQNQFGPLNIRLGFTRQWTNSASPFSKTLDKLEPLSQLSLSTTLSGPLSSELRGDLIFKTRYDFLSIEHYLGQGFSELGFTSKLSWNYQDLTFSPYLLGEFASLANPALDKDVFLEGGLDVFAPRWEAGVSARLNPSEGKLTKIEARTSFPIDFETVTLKPYLALDILPTLTGSDFPRISGHGLEVILHTCCGTVSAGYRQQENTFKTLIGFSLE
jgi:hypothetical protein